MPARATASRTTSAPSSVAVKSFSAPRNLPVGVRTAETMTDSRMCGVSSIDASSLLDRRRRPSRCWQLRKHRRPCALDLLQPPASSAWTDSTPSRQFDRRRRAPARGRRRAATRTRSSRQTPAGARTISTRVRGHDVLGRGSMGVIVPDDSGSGIRKIARSRHSGSAADLTRIPILSNRMRLILASASPRRAELLTPAGFAFDVDRRRRRRDAAGRAKRRSVRAARGAGQGAPRRGEARCTGPSCSRPTRSSSSTARSSESRGTPTTPQRMLRRLSGGRTRCSPAVVVRAADGETSEVVTTRVAFPAPDRRGDRLVRRARRADGQGRRLRDPGARVAVHRPDRRLLVERRRAADCDGLPPAEPGP